MPNDLETSKQKIEIDIDKIIHTTQSFNQTPRHINIYLTFHWTFFCLVYVLSLDTMKLLINFYLNIGLEC